MLIDRPAVWYASVSATQWLMHAHLADHHAISLCLPILFNSKLPSSSATEHMFIAQQLAGACTVDGMKVYEIDKEHEHLVHHLAPRDSCSLSGLWILIDVCFVDHNLFMFPFPHPSPL